MANAEGAIERLYEDADVRDELKDDEANTLLKWAEDRLNMLAAQSATDEEFDSKAAQFRGLLKGMNRLVGNRATLDAVALNTRLAELSAQATSVSASGDISAQAAAPSLPADQLKSVADKLPSLDDAGAVDTLTALFTPNTLTPSPSPSGREEQDKPKESQPPVVPALAPIRVLATDSTPAPDAPEAVAEVAAPPTAAPVRGKPHVSAQTPPPPSPAPTTPVQSAPVQASADDDGGFLHRFSIHFWHPRKKTPPQ